MSASRLLVTIFLLLGTWALVAGCGSDSVAPPAAPVEDEAPVLPVENVTATVSAVDKLIIRWDPNSHPRLKGYNVYRSEIAAQNTVMLTPAPVPQTEYRDITARRGVEYEYRVTAVTKADKESIYTAVTVLLEADPLGGPDNEGTKRTME